MLKTKLKLYLSNPIIKNEKLLLVITIMAKFHIWNCYVLKFMYN